VTWKDPNNPDSWTRGDFLAPPHIKHMWEVPDYSTYPDPRPTGPYDEEREIWTNADESDFGVYEERYVWNSLTGDWELFEEPDLMSEDIHIDGMPEE
jgi:hypothetical protein